MPGAGADRNDDDALVACVRAGDDRAFEQLYLRYQRRIAAYVYGMVHDHGRAEDITQDVFISALRRMRATDAHIAFKPWIYEIAKNACIDAFRRSKRAEEISYDVEDGAERLHLTSNGPTPDAAVDTRMSLDHLRGAFGGLSEAHHQILVMRELEGLSYRQIGERLGMSRPSVESTLFRARRRLSEEYEELVSGERCRRVQTIIAGATGGQVGTRDERKMARHVSHCQPCRRAALVAGFDLETLTPKRTAREKIAALLPLPWFLKRFIGGSSADHSGLLSAAAHYGDSASGGWMKLAAAASALALAGLGAHEVAINGGGEKHDAAGTAVAAAAATPASTRSSASTSGGVGQHGAAGAAHRIVSSRSSGSTVHHKSSLGSSPSKTTGAGGSTSSGSGAGAGAGSSGSSGSNAAAADNKGGSGGSDPVGDATRTVNQTVNGATGGGSTPQVPKVQLPTVQLPDLPGAPPVISNTVHTVNGVVAGATQTVNGTVGGVTDTANKTVNQTTTTVNQTVGGLGGVVGGTTKGVGDTVKGVTGATGKLLGGG
jgi:RNA polymerase sigma factor (sigma-70 family)